MQVWVWPSARHWEADPPGDHPLVARLLELDLPAGDWALFGSGPLLMRGWIDEVGDLGVISRRRAWAEAQRLGTPQTLKSDGAIIYELADGITVGASWAYGDMDIDLLIDTAETIGRVPCVGLEHVVAYKQEANRARDRRHLAIIEAHS